MTYSIFIVRPHSLRIRPSVSTLKVLSWASWLAVKNGSKCPESLSRWCIACSSYTAGRLFKLCLTPLIMGCRPSWCRKLSSIACRPHISPVAALGIRVQPYGKSLLNLTLIWWRTVLSRSSWDMAFWGVTGSTLGCCGAEDPPAGPGGGINPDGSGGWGFPWGGRFPEDEDCAGGGEGELKKYLCIQSLIYASVSPKSTRRFSSASLNSSSKVGLSSGLWYTNRYISWHS